jgi:adenylate cyclase regulatory protein
MDDRERLLCRLQEAGCSSQELEQAERDERLPTLAVERALGSSGAHTLTAVARAAKLDTQFVRALVQAMGRPSSAPRQRAFSDEDIEVARLVRSFIDAGLPRAELLEVARVLSLGMSHTADAVRRAVGDSLLSPGDSQFTIGLRYPEAGAARAVGRAGRSGQNDRRRGQGRPDPRHRGNPAPGTGPRLEAHPLAQSPQGHLRPTAAVLAPRPGGLNHSIILLP